MQILKTLSLFLALTSIVSFGFTTNNNVQKADLIIFSFDRPMQLNALLDSLKTYVSNIKTTYVLYRSSNQAYQKAYDEVQHLFPHVNFVAQGIEPKKDFKQLFLWCLNESSSPYILFAPDDLIVKDYVDMNHCINALKKYNAYGFYLRLGTHITHSYTQSIDITMPQNREVEPGLYTFAFEGKSYWGYPNTLDFALFKKETILKELTDLQYHSPNTLEGKWAKLAQKTYQGLFFKASKALNMPLNLVQQDWVNTHEDEFSAAQLLELWNQGLKINVQPYHKIENNSCHMPYKPTFIKRPAQDIPQKKITIIIPSYNNAPYFEQNLQSVLNQNYDNFHIIYIDDASKDNTGNLVEGYIKKYHLEDKITLIKNTYNRKALANIYKAIHLCDPQDIIMELDGDDALSHPNILNEINAYFSTYDIWFAYAQYRNLPEEKAIAYKVPLFGIAKPVPQAQVDSRKFRGTWLWSGLRIFYAWLAQQIKLEDLLLPKDPLKGKFFPTSKDAAIVYPMLEMCGDKFMFIPDVWLSRNVDTPINDFKVANDFQKHCGEALKAIASYKMLFEPVVKSQKNEMPSTDILILANTPENLEKLLISLKIKLLDSTKKYILVHEKNAKLFKKMKKNLPHLIWLEYNPTTLAKIMQNISLNKYTIILHDTKKIRQIIPLNDCIKKLEQTQAHAFYFDVDLSHFDNGLLIQSFACEQLDNDIFTWKFSCMPGVMEQSKNMLIRSNDLQALIKATKINGEFDSIFKQMNKAQKIGLFFEQKRIN